ncbi:hypothetical protein H4Q26_004221 [Puccinia striiformis f. sp. tritici PST-130]|nr:hypothetical protein H4Q26_004221 [Puccinia striiformis f. sp. tritici PST-130]
MDGRGWELLATCDFTASVITIDQSTLYESFSHPPEHILAELLLQSLPCAHSWIMVTERALRSVPDHHLGESQPHSTTHPRSTNHLPSITHPRTRIPLISTGDLGSINRTTSPTDTNPFHSKNTPTRALTPDLDTNLLDLVILSSLISANHRRSIVRITTSFSMTPVENQNLIQHYLTIVKQQRADNPPPPPFVDPLTSNERLDRIIKNVLADQEAELDHKIFLNQSLREYRKDKKMEAIARRDSIYEFMIHLTSELLKDPRPTLHSRDFDAALFKRKFEKLEKILSNDKNNPLYTQNLATFNIRFERYQEALIQAQEIEVQATQTKDKTVIPTTKVLKIEHQSAPIDKLPSPIPEVTGNFHLDKHLAKTSITDKPANKKEKITKKKTLPLESTLGDSSISSFTTEPYFEDLEPTTRLPSPFLKKITLKKELPVITDSEERRRPRIYRSLILSRSREDSSSSNPNLEPLHPDPEKRAKQARRTDEVPQTMEGNDQTPQILGDYPQTPFVERKSDLQRDGERNRERERRRDSRGGNHQDPHQETRQDPRLVLKGDSGRGHEENLGSSSTEPTHLQKLIPNKEIESYVSGWNPWIEKKKREQPSGPKSLEQPQPSSLEQHSKPSPLGRTREPRPLEQQPKTGSFEQSVQQQATREESEDLEDAVRWAKSKALSSLSTINHNLTTLEANHDVNTSKLLRVVEKCYVKSAKTLSEISDQLSDPLPVQMGPLEKSLVYHLKKEIDKVSNLVKDIHGTSNPEGIESLTTQIKYLRDTVYNLQNKQKELVNSLPKQSNESISDIFASLRIEIKSLTDIASVLSQKPTPDNSADIMEKLEQSEASILSNVKQDLITEVRVYVQKEVETLTTTVTTSFEGIMSQLRNMEQNSNDKFNNLQRDIVEIKKEIISVDNRVAKAESNRLTSPLTHSSPTPFKTVVETENKNSPSKDLPPHQTQSIKEDDDRGPRLTEKEVGKLLPPLTEWVSFSGEGEYDYIEFIQYCDLILETYWAKEDIVVVRLPRLFRGVAKVWWKTKSAAMGKASWQTWKDLMKAQFNTSTWRSKMKEAFRKEKLDPSKPSIMNTFSLYTALLLALSINAFPSQHKDSHKGYTAQSQASPSYLPTSSGYSPINVHQTLSSASNPTPAGYSSRISSGQNSQLDAAAGGYGHGGAPAEKGFRATEGLAANGGSEERPTTPTGFGVEGFKKPGPVPFFGSAFPPSTGDYIEADQQTGPVIHSALRTQTGEAPSGHAADQPIKQVRPYSSLSHAAGSHSATAATPGGATRADEVRQGYTHSPIKRTLTGEGLHARTFNRVHHTQTMQGPSSLQISTKCRALARFCWSKARRCNY